MLEYDNALSFSKKIRSHPTYRHNKSYQLSGGQSVILSAGSTSESVFELPTSSHVVNHSKSFLKFTLNVASAGGVLYNRLHMNGVSMIDRIMLQTKSGVQLCDITNVPNYTSMVNPYLTKLSDFVTRDSAQVAALDVGVSDNSMMNPSRALVANTLDLSVTGTAGTCVIDNSDLSGYYTSPVEDGTGIASVIYMNVVLPLDVIAPDSILGLDRDMFYGETLLLYIYWSATPRIAWVGSHATQVHTNAVAPTGITINKLTLYNAVESNIEIQNGLMDKARSGEGISMIVPFVYGYKTTTNNSASSSVQTRLSRAHGVNLLRVWTALFDSRATLQASMLNSNSNNSVLIDIYDEMNSQRLSDVTWSSAANELYLALRDKFEGSVIQNSAMFRRHQCWLRDFTNLKCIDFVDNNTSEDGVSLAQEQIYTTNLTKSADNRIIYTYCVTQKILNIGASGITLM